MYYRLYCRLYYIDCIYCYNKYNVEKTKNEEKNIVFSKDFFCETNEHLKERVKKQQESCKQLYERVPNNNFLTFREIFKFKRDKNNSNFS